MTGPLITVLTTVHNDAPYIGECIESILAQDYKDFHYLIVDDGSTDGTQEIIRSYQDSRLRLIELPENVGISRAANRGLAEIDTRYVARIDGDDVAMPQRLTKQVAFMEAHPEVGVCGSWARYVGLRGDLWKVPVDDETCRAKVIFAPPFVHPSTVIRTSVLKTAAINYRKELETLVDFGLWWDMLPHTQFSNLPEPLVHYRLSGTNVSQQYRFMEFERMAKLFKTVSEKYELPSDEDAITAHVMLAKSKFFRPDFDLSLVQHRLQVLRAWNERYCLVPEAAFEKELDSRWREIFYALLDIEPKAIVKFIQLSGGLEPQLMRYALRLAGSRVKRFLAGG